MAKIPTYLLNLAGEYRVCSELNKRGVFATVTYGNHKGVDVYAISDQGDLAVRIEVKTSQQGNFVTKLTQKGSADDRRTPDFWVLCQIKAGDYSSFRERFFILTHKEISRIQAKRNKIYGAKYLARHGSEFDFSKGIDNVKLADVEAFEDGWDKILVRLGLPAIV